MTRPVVQWVNDSAVRAAVLRTVADGSASTETILRRVDASESAVYAALNALERRDLLVEDEDSWVVTGRGQTVADLLEQRGNVESLFDGEDNYWQTHDVSVLPRHFRLRLGALAGYEVIRITDTDPTRVVRTVANHIEAADSVEILAPIYQDAYAQSLPDNPESRLLLSQDVIEGALADRATDPDAERPEETAIRIGTAPVGLTITDDVTLVSFPKLDGSYDTRTELRVETDVAAQWASDLFSYYWARAVPAPDT